MQLFILENVQDLTDSYHSGGGLVIIAENLIQANELIINGYITDHRTAYYGITSDELHRISVTQEEWDSVVIYDLDPKRDYEPTVFIFPDAGCC